MLPFVSGRENGGAILDPEGAVAGPGPAFPASGSGGRF